MLPALCWTRCEPLSLNVMFVSPVQVCGRAWLPVLSWSVPWRPCSGSSMTPLRSTSACPAPLPLRCQSPWRRSSASQSNHPRSLHPSTELQSQSTLLNPELPQHTRQFSIFMSSAPAALRRPQSCCYNSCIFKNRRWNCHSWLTKSHTEMFFSRNACLVLSFPVIRKINSNKRIKFPGKCLYVFFLNCSGCQVVVEKNSLNFDSVFLLTCLL